MKKTLMVLSFALCATFVFAQNAGLRNSQELMAASKATAVQTDLSKALFVKDGTPLITVDFHDGTADANNNYTGTGYSTGIVTGGTDAHAQSYAFAKWRRWPNLDQSTIEGVGSNTMSSVYSYLYQAFGTDFATAMVNWADSATSSAENGFMMMTMIDQRTDQTGNFNAFIQFSTVDASAAGVVDIQFFQRYRKFYDYCYVDYRTSASGNWTEVEINVGGVDASVNDDMAGFVTYTLPLATAGQANLDIRIRWKSLDSHRSNAYGYWWLIDDVSIIAGDADRFLYKSEEYVEGNYGIVPMGLTMNPAWYGLVKNTGANNQTNVTATIYHLTADQATQTQISTQNNGTAVAGDWMEPICDHFGWIYADTVDYRGWTCYNYDPTAAGTGIPMPTSTVGGNYLYANLSSDALSHDFDTMYYQVVGLDNSILTGGAYRWGHDNGVLTYAPSNHYIFGRVQQGVNWYVTDDPDEVHFYEAGYQVTTAFKTGDAVPTGWAIRGVELVAAPLEAYNGAGTAISALLQRDSCDDEGSIRFTSVNTGAGIHTLVSSDFNDSTIIGRGSHGYRELGQYNTIVIPFPEQPLLRPYSTYRAGYVIEEDGPFALARESWGSYREASPTRPDTYDTIYYFRNNPATKKYANPFKQNVYQNTVWDPNHPSDNEKILWAEGNYEFQPMIHLLVGPQQEVQRVNVTINCDSTDYGDVAYAGEAVCGSVITPVEGSSPIISLVAMTGCHVLSLAIDGVEVELYDEVSGQGDPNYTEISATTRQYMFNGITGDHTVMVIFTENPEPPVTIDPVAANVNMNLQPNPATSQVTLNVEGVEGMVDCAIIDMSGRVVFNSTFNAANEQVINLSDIAKGAYFVRITNNNFSKVEKLIVR